jgi:hypothetical protein
MTAAPNRTIPRWLAGGYLLWSLLVYFGTLGGDGHSWWPIFLYPLIWPLSWMHHEAQSYILHRFVPDPRSVPDSLWIYNDWIAGAFYIVAGTAWLWYMGTLLSRAATRMFPQEQLKL